jgi:hypothetical protein
MRSPVHILAPFVVAFALAAASPSPLDPVRVRYVVRVCEGEKLELVADDEFETREKECVKPLPGIPLQLLGETSRSGEVFTDGTGLATVGPIDVRRDEALRLAMACTTHNCMTLRLRGVGAGDVREGDNMLLVFAVPKSSAAEVPQAAPK